MQSRSCFILYCPVTLQHALQELWILVKYPPSTYSSNNHLDICWINEHCGFPFLEWHIHTWIWKLRYNRIFMSYLVKSFKQGYHENSLPSSMKPLKWYIKYDDLCLCIFLTMRYIYSIKFSVKSNSYISHQNCMFYKQSINRYCDFQSLYQLLSNTVMSRTYVIQTSKELIFHYRLLPQNSGHERGNSK